MFAWPSNRCSVRVVVLVAILVAINFFPFVRPGFSLTKLVLSVGETNISGVSSLTPIDPTIDPTINPTRLEIGFLTVTSTESPNFLARSFEAIFYQSSEGVSSSTLGDTTLRSDPTVSFGTPKVDSGSEQATNPGLATATEGPDSDEEPDSNEEPERPAAVSGWSAVGPAAKYHQLGFTPPQPNFVKNPWPVNVAIRNSCCYSGIRCQKAAPRYSIWVWAKSASAFSGGSCSKSADWDDYYFSQKHLRCLGSRLVALAARERYGFDERVDGGEAVGNSLGRAALGGNRWKRRLGGRRGNRGK